MLSTTLSNTRALVLLGALLGAGCGSTSPESGPTTVESKAGLFRGRFEPDPNPPVTGKNALDTLLTESSGHTLVGAKLSAAASMPSDGMTSSPPTVDDQGDGHYRIQDLVYSMPGQWQVRVTVQAGGQSDEFLVDLEVH